MDSFSFNKYASYCIFVYLIAVGFDTKNERHHSLLLCLLMTASDLSDQTKPWDNTKHVAVRRKSLILFLLINTDLFLFGELLMVHVVKNVPLSVTGADLQGVLLAGWHGEVAGTEAGGDDGPGAGQNPGPSDWIPGPHRSPSLQVSQSLNVNVLNFKLLGKGLGCKAMNSVNLFCI